MTGKIHADDLALLEGLRDKSADLATAKAKLIEAPAGVLNTIVHLQISDNLLLCIANDLQRRAYDVARQGLPLDEALRNWYFKAECLRTVLADARTNASMERHGFHKPACYTPAADYECKPKRTEPAAINFDALAMLRGRFAEAHGRYMLAQGIITGPGKFGGEHIACPIYWDMCLEQGFSSESWSHEGLGCWEWIEVDATDCAMWPDLDLMPGDIIELHEADSGFVSMDTLRGAAIEARREELDALCYGDSDTVE